VDPVERTLRESTAGVAGTADPTWHLVEDGVSTLDVTFGPEGPDGFGVAWSSHEVIVSFGQDSRIELGPGDEDVALLSDIVASLIGGRVRRRGRAAAVILPDGSTIGDRV
jgi:hypothetical protein